MGVGAAAGVFVVFFCAAAAKLMGAVGLVELEFDVIVEFLFIKDSLPR